MRHTLAIALLFLLPATQAEAWSARKEPPRPGQHQAKKPAKTAPTAAPLHDRVLAWLQSAKRSARAGLALLKEAVIAQQTADVRVLAEALADMANVPVPVLVEAATALAQGQDDPVQRRLWQRAWTSGRDNRVVIAEGYADSLAAAGQPDEARKVVEAALHKTPRGQRRSLLDRLVALGRVAGDLQGVLEQLRTWSDPDAAVLAAAVHGELGDDDEALGTLRNAWKTWPGHRGLQAAYMGLLARTGAREELAQVAAQVVRLSPADPMPWLAVLDAHITARDLPKARALIDDLARKHPAHDALLEALIDREQRLGDETDRLARLYEALLRAAPREAQYIEAYAEWLLGRGELDAARLVLAKLRKLPGGEFAGLQRAATLLLAHGKLEEVKATAARMAALKPGDPRVIRLQALLSERMGRPQDADAGWQELSLLPETPSPNDRARALEARQALAALYRKTATLPKHVELLANKVQTKTVLLGEALLYLELYGQLDRTPTPAEETLWIGNGKRIRAWFPKDPEALHAIATGLLHIGQTTEALPVLEDLAKVDADVAEPLLAGLVESALGHGDAAMARKIEGLLLREGTGQTPAASVLLKLGDVHLRYGDSEGAAALFRRAAAANPRDTRAIARLASLFRLAGADAEEDRALRDIVLKASEADELDAAGQRLLTLALAQGRSGELVRWLDTVMPQHARRDMLERLRIAAYDAWLRTAALDRQLGKQELAPAPSSLGDALASGDLAMQVRALRQLAALGRSVPPMVAKQLLHSPNAVLRRDVALAIGASHAEAGARALVDAMSEGSDQDDDVVRAQLAALTSLPRVAGVEAVLKGLLGRPEPGGMAALVLGHLGADNVLPDLAHMARSTRREVQPAALLAIGAVLSLRPNVPQAPLALNALVEASPLAAGNWPANDYLRAAAAIWGMAAASHAHTRAELVRVALRADSQTLQGLAIALLAAPHVPVLASADVQPGDDDGLRDLRSTLIRRTLAPWLTRDADTDRLALAKLDAELGGALQDLMATTDPDEIAGRWCQRWGDRAAAQSRLARTCAGVRP